MIGIHRNFPAGGGSTADATAEQWQIVSGETAYIASGKVTGNGYFPAMMQFDGSSGYYEKTGLTASGNKCTLVMRFQASAGTGGAAETLFSMHNDTDIDPRVRVALFDSDHATAALRNKIAIFVENTAGMEICKLWSINALADDAPHTLFFSFDGDVGAATFIIDGEDADDTGNVARVAPTTGTLETASMDPQVGRFFSGAPQYFAGQIGFLGYRDAYLTNWSDFMRSDGSPIYQDTSSWAGTGWGAQPLLWNPHGDMVNNLGSAGAMTKTGAINVAAAT